MKITPTSFILTIFFLGQLQAAPNPKPSRNEQTVQTIESGSGGSLGSVWTIIGNAGTSSGVAGTSTAGTNFIGTTDAQNLEVHLNNSTSTFFRFTQKGVLEFIDPTQSLFLGLGAGLNNNGNYNTAIGSYALNYNNSGTQNCAIGQSALLYNQSGNNNVAIGYFSLRSNLNSNSTAIGANALQSNYFGSENTAVGSQAMSSDTGGFQNTAVGAQSLNTNTIGNKITCIGYGTDVSSDGFENATAIGYGAVVNGSNTVVIGNNNVTTIGGAVNWTVPSDGQLKTAIKENVAGLAFIKKLRPITYKLDMSHLPTYKSISADNRAMAFGSHQDQTVRTGLIAQEVEKAAMAIDYDFDGIIKPQNENDHYRLSYASFVVPLIKAVQEQQLMIEALQKEIAYLKSERY